MRNTNESPAQRWLLSVQENYATGYNSIEQLWVPARLIWLVTARGPDLPDLHFTVRHDIGELKQVDPPKVP
jgi:hypothetical protein